MPALSCSGRGFLDKDFKLIAEITQQPVERLGIKGEPRGRTSRGVGRSSPFSREWTAERGIELVDSGALLARLAHEQSSKLGHAHRLPVERSPKSEGAILGTMERIIGHEAANTVRAVVTIEADPQRRSDSTE